MSIGSAGRPGKPSVELVSAAAEIDDQLRKPATAPIDEIAFPAQRSLRPTKPRFRLQSGGPSFFGRLAMGIATAGVILGTMLGDPEATTGRGPQAVQPPTIEASVQRTEAHFVDDLLRRGTAVLAPLGIDRGALLRGFERGTLSIRIDDRHVLSGSPGLEIPAGTRVTTSFGSAGVTLLTEPALRWRVDWWPDGEIERLTYDFASGSFSAGASGLGPDGIYEDLINDSANDLLRSRLPAAMQRPGYDLWQDPDLVANVQHLVDLIRSSEARSSETPAAPVTGPAISGLSAPGLSLVFRVPNTSLIPIPNTEFTAKIEAGTSLDITARFTGPLSAPKLDYLTVYFDRDLEVAQGTGEERSSLKKIDIRSITLRSGGEIEMDYQLGPEQMVDGVKALFTIFALMAEPRAQVGDLRTTRMEGARLRVQARIDGDVEPQLHQLIRANDAAIPGLSLIDVFGTRP